MLRKMVALLFCVALLVLIVPATVDALAENADAVPQTTDGDRGVMTLANVDIGDYTYRVENGVATIAKYNGTASSVTVPTNVTIDGVSYLIRSVDAYAFEDCVSIRTLVIPAQITSLGKCAFKNCTSLSSITINGNLGKCNDYSTSTSSWSSDHYRNNSVFYNTGANAGSLTVTFGDEVTAIPANLFATGGAKSANDYAHVTKLVLGSKVASIGYSAFFHCYDLNSITWNNSITSIGDSVFDSCTSLPSLNLPAKMANIGEWAFYNCTGLTSITIPATVTSIGRSAFENCSSVKTLTINAKSSSVGKCAFKNCTNLSSITINGNLGNGNDYSTSTSSWSSDHYSNNSVFYNTGTNTSSMTVTFGDGVTAIPANLFATGGAQSASDYAHITQLVIGSKVTSIGYNAFYHCYDLKSITWNKSLTSIGSSAFRSCISLPSLSLPAKVATIGGSAFNSCTGLTSITIPASVTSVGDYAFENCSSAKTLTINAKSASLNKGAFKNCTALKTIAVNGNLADCNKYSTSTSSWNSDHYRNNSVFYNVGANASSLKVTFGDAVTRIPSYLFATGGVQTDGDYARITKLVIGKKVTSIGYAAFYRCFDLTSVSVPANVLTLEKRAFDSETLKSVTINNPSCDIADGGIWSGSALTLTGYLDSTAEKYAAANGYKFKATMYDAPKITKVSGGAGNVTVKWKAVTGAVNYRLFYKTSSGWKKIGDTNSTSYTWTKAKGGTNYTFTVRCVSGDGKKYASKLDSKGTKYSVPISAPKITKISGGAGNVTIKWGKETGAVKYRVYYKTTGSWKKLVDTTKTSYTWKKAKAGTKYTFTVRCITSDGKSASSYNKTGTSYTVPYATPKITKVSGKAGSVKITWGKVSGAAKYRVFYKTADGWKKLTDTTSTSYTWKGAKAGKTYTFTVRCIDKAGKNYTSDYNTKGTKYKVPSK